MKERKKISPQALYNLRRLRKARRLYKKNPVFAYTTMLEYYPDYTNEQFLKDLTIRKKKLKEKKRRQKYNLKREIGQQMYEQIRMGKEELINPLVRLINHFREDIQFNVKGTYYRISNQTSHFYFEQLKAAINEPEEFDRLFEEQFKYSRYGN